MPQGWAFEFLHRSGGRCLQSVTSKLPPAGSKADCYLASAAAAAACARPPRVRERVGCDRPRRIQERVCSRIPLQQGERVLLGSAIWLRFRDREGVDSVTTGLLAGALPLATGLLLARFDLRCGLAGSETYCSVFSVMIGTLAGFVIALRENRWRRRLVSFFAAGAIASLSAALGCVRLGVWGVVSMVAGIVAGSLLGVAIFKRPAA